MSDKTEISWTDATWNPTSGCTKISPGCANCYIERTPPFRIAGRKFVNGKIPLELHADRLDKPLRWKKPRRVFVNSLSDLFHEDVDPLFIGRVFNIMGTAKQHSFQVLTKRAERMKNVITAYYETLGIEPYPNVWLGVSVENRKHGLPRIEHLLRTPAAVRFLSVEPLLEDIDLDFVNGKKEGHYSALTGRLSHFKGVKVFPSGVDWVIVGSESGHNRRPMEQAWAQSIADQCRTAGVAFFMKQMEVDGKVTEEIERFPEQLRIREFPPSEVNQ